MGIIRAITSAVGGGLADSWLEVIEAEEMSSSTLVSRGVAVRAGDARNRNRKGTSDTISNGSVIHVYDNQCMLLIEGGKVVDYSAEPGYYKVDSSAMPSLFNGQLGDSLRETFLRVKFGGTPSSAQKVVFINLQEIRDIAFGTVNPVNYFDNFYNAELYFRTHGYFSVHISDPLKFYAQVVDKNSLHMTTEDFRSLFLAEFLGELQSALNRLSIDGVRASHVVSQTGQLTGYMRDILDAPWRDTRGMEIESVGIKSITFDEQSKELLHIRSQGAMLQDASVREGYVQGGVARGMEAAGSNAGGAMAGFMGVGLGMQTSGLGEFSQTNRQQMQAKEQSDGWQCSCGKQNDGQFCPNCGAKKPQESAGTQDGWRCVCGRENDGQFCPDCGKKRPQSVTCPKCGKADLPQDCRFCPQCGEKMQ